MRQKNYVLVIEDDEKDEAMITECLKKEGWEFIVAKNGTDALRLAQENTPGLIILDLMLPGVNGFKLAQIFKADMALKETPIIVLSVLNTTDKSALIKRLGVEEQLAKPVDIQILAQTAGKYIGKGV